MEKEYFRPEEEVLEEPQEVKPLFSGVALARQLAVCFFVVLGVGLIRALPKEHMLVKLISHFHYAIRADGKPTFGFLERQPVIFETVQWVKGSLRSAKTTPVSTTNLLVVDGFVPPVPGKVLRPFTWRPGMAPTDPNLHPGIDLAAPIGRPVRASRTGVVQEVKQENNGGWRVVVVHKGGWQTVYANCSRVCVRLGEQVQTGQELAVSGKSLEEGAGVHWEIWKERQPVDPGKYLK